MHQLSDGALLPLEKGVRNNPCHSLAAGERASNMVLQSPGNVKQKASQKAYLGMCCSSRKRHSSTTPGIIFRLFSPCGTVLSAVGCGRLLIRELFLKQQHLPGTDMVCAHKELVQSADTTRVSQPQGLKLSA